VEQQADAFLKKVRELGSSQAALQSLRTQAAGGSSSQWTPLPAASPHGTWRLSYRRRGSAAQAGWKSSSSISAVPASATRAHGSPTPTNSPTRCARSVVKRATRRLAKCSRSRVSWLLRRPPRRSSILCGRAAEAGIPIFIFHEYHREQMAEEVSVNPQTKRAFREIARAGNGAYCHFDAGAADTLRQLRRTSRRAH
jgi:hypothetical protein